MKEKVLPRLKGARVGNPWQLPRESIFKVYQPESLGTIRLGGDTMDRIYRFKPKQPKFSQEKASEIREGHNRGCSYRELAALYRTDKNTVLAICRQRGAYSKYRNWVQTGES